MGFKNTFHSSYATGHARGVAILIANKVDFQLSKQITDKEGRFVLVRGTLDSKEVTLLNIYRPPGQDRTLIDRIFDLIATEVSGVLICGGDWNAQLHPTLDSLNPTKKMNSESLYIKKMIKRIGLIDVWRDFHPTVKHFTFFSHPHAVYSRIDYFFVFKADGHRVRDCCIGVRDVSDHSGVYLKLHLDAQQKNIIWRLNTTLLNDNQFVNFIKNETKDYTEFNSDKELSPSILWDAAKAVLRGKIIMWASQKKKEKIKRLNDLINELDTLEQKHIETNDPSLLEQISVIKSEINKKLDDKVELKLKYIKQTYYENGPRAKKILAWRLRKQLSERSIFKIKNPVTNQICHRPQEIHKTFEIYYKKLYSQPKLAEPSTVKHSLDSLDLPSIGIEQNKRITTDITKAEIDKAISKLKTSKPPGGDGLPAEWYKTFRDSLTLLQLKCFNYVLKGGETPPSWKQAIISVIPKPGKDRTECSSYKPISVLNTDYKIFTSRIVNRLENITADLTDTDQTGFIKNKRTQDNTGRAMLLIDIMSKSNMKSLAISFDAEKAFDSVRWEFLYLVLQHFSFNDTIIRCLQSIYNSPTARIKINGSLSSTISLERGCRQGCPLSPILFALFIEPLAQKIREDPKIMGISFRGREYKTGLYADDILVTLSDPDASLPNLMSCLDQFGFYSGYKLNIEKTQTLSFNYSPGKVIHRTFKFKWKTKIMKYLGVNIPKTLKDVYYVNYGVITNKIKDDLDRWSPLTLDLYTRIETIKMIILPQLLFLFQSLSVEVPTKQFNEWNRTISRFIWRNKKPRARYKTLHLSKDEGGMSIPCLESCYEAAQLQYVIYWCDVGL